MTESKTSSKQETAYHHGDLKQALLDAAEALLEEGGVAGLSLRNVARKAGVSHTAPYRHFADKTALLNALATVGYQRLADGMMAAVQRHPDDPKAQMDEAGQTYVRLAVRHPEMTHLMFGGTLKPVSHEETPECHNMSFAGLLRIVENGLEAGIFHPRPARDIAITAWATMHGLSLLVTSGKMQDALQTEAQIEQLVRMVEEVLSNGLFRTPPPN